MGQFAFDMMMHGTAYSLLGRIGSFEKIDLFANSGFAGKHFFARMTVRLAFAHAKHAGKTKRL